MTTVFISHTWRDGEHDFAVRLAKELRSHGIKVWLDEKRIQGDELIKERMVNGVRSECDVFLFVMSPASVFESWGCKVELDEAIKNRSQSGVQIVPILLKDLVQEEIPDSLREVKYVDFRNKSKFEYSMQHLLSSINEAAKIRTCAKHIFGGDPDKRAMGARYLGEIVRNPHSLPILAWQLTNDSFAQARYWAAVSIGMIGGENACKILTEAKQTENDQYVLLGIQEGFTTAEC